MTSCATSCCQEIAVLNLRGRFENSLVADVALEDRVDRRAAGRSPRPRRCRRPGEPRITRGVSPHASVVSMPEALEPLPDRRHVLDLDPVVLDVLPVGDVGGVAGVGLADLTERAQLLGGERAAVEADAEHEVAVVELLGLQHRGAAAVDAGPALGVEAPPAHPAAQVGGVDRVEPALAVDRLDPGADVQPVVVLLDALVRVERLAVAELPLAFAALALGRSGPGRGWCGGGHVPLPPDRGRALRPWCGGRHPAPWWWYGRADSAAVSTEGAVHPVQVDVATRDEAQQE